MKMRIDMKAMVYKNLKKHQIAEEIRQNKETLKKVHSDFPLRLPYLIHSGVTD